MIIDVLEEKNILSIKELIEVFGKFDEIFKYLKK